MQPAPESSDAPPRLRLQPFRALRYETDRLDDLWAVTAPPYDLLDDDTTTNLLAAHPHNVVRLILPRRQASPAPAYAMVADLLSQWRRAGVLRTDRVPGLYVYEYTTDGVVVRGLVGCVSLHTPQERVVLPHEDVLRGPVNDRLALMLATRANLEPILLAYDGGGFASDIVESTTAGQPLAEASAPGGSRHRVWQINEPAILGAVAADLAPRQALIADGHHRYATYRLLQSRLSGTDLAAPAQFGLALLVDQQRHPLRVDAIHRSVSGLTLAAVRTAGQVAVSGWPDAATALAQLSGPAAAAFVLTDGETWLTARVRTDTSAGGTRGAADEIAALHGQLLPQWGIAESQVRYHHDVQAALRAARVGSDVAVLTRAPTVDEVMAAARDGERMPRKSTSFGPKPRMGLLARLLDPS